MEKFRAVTYASMLPIALTTGQYSGLRQRKQAAYALKATCDHAPDRESWHEEEGEQHIYPNQRVCDFRMYDPPVLTRRQAQLHGLEAYEGEECTDVAEGMSQDMSCSKIE